MLVNWFIIEGRIGRKVYFVRFITLFILFIAGLIVSKYLTAIHRDYGETLYSIVFFLGACLFCCVNAQRMHDLNKSGWWQLTLCVPFVLLVLIFKKGTDGTNHFGPDPLKRKRLNQDFTPS